MLGSWWPRARLLNRDWRYTDIPRSINLTAELRDQRDLELPIDRLLIFHRIRRRPKKTPPTARCLRRDRARDLQQGSLVAHCARTSRLLMATVTFLLGLCGSGKSYLARELRRQRGALVFEDLLHDNAALLPKLIDALKEGKDCVVHEIQFCFEENRTEITPLAIDTQRTHNHMDMLRE